MSAHSEQHADRARVDQLARDVSVLQQDMESHFGNVRAFVARIKQEQQPLILAREVAK